MRSLMLTGLVMSALLLVGCAGSGGGAPSRGSGGGAPEPAVNGSGGAMGPAPAIGAAPYEGDFQVIFFQANGAQTMILVNEGHKARGTDAGRRRLALNIPGGGYKVLEERSMKALLKSLEERQYSQLSTPFRRGDERWFAPGADPRFRGMIFVDRKGTRQKLLGFRAAGANDGVGHQRYRAFVDLKLVFLNWYQGTSRTEAPESGRRGAGGR